MVMSSTLSSSLSQAFTAMFSNSFTASYGLFRIKAGTTVFMTSSFEMNYHSPSDPTTINLFSVLCQIYILLFNVSVSRAHRSLQQLMQHNLRTTSSSPNQECFAPESKLETDQPALHLHLYMEKSSHRSFEF